VSRDADPNPLVHRRRRQQLLDRLGDGVLLLPTAPELHRNGDVLHEYRPGSDLHYLTGFPEPDAVLVAWRERERGHRAVLFVRPRDPAREIWDGKRFGAKGAVRTFGVDAAFPVGQLWQRLPKLLEGRARLFHRLGVDATFDRRLLDLFAQLAKKHRRRQPAAHPDLIDPVPAIAAQRLVKDAHEQAAMQRAGAISAAGHRAAMQAARPGLFEFEVQAVLEAEFRRHGSPRNGYPSIVASGSNACVLHYHDNDRRLRAGDLLLIDAGAECGGHTADITRTFPVSGTFTPAQAAVYRVVLRAQIAGIRACRAGARWDGPSHLRAFADPRPGRTRRAARAAAAAAEEGGLQAVLHARHQPLARPRRARRRRLPRRAGSAGAAAGRRGADRRAGALLRPARSPRAERAARHRHPHRRRRADHGEGAAGADGGGAEDDPRDRSALPAGLTAGGREGQRGSGRPAPHMPVPRSTTRTVCAISLRSSHSDQLSM
jgi:Xaa-Pro aminopeptidase